MKAMLLIVMATVLTSCHVNKECSINVRSHLYDIYTKANSEEMKDIKITKFAYIGDITVNNQEYYVIDLRTVIKGMLSPRGINYILIYNDKMKLIEKVYYSLEMPLWCEGSKIYLWGPVTQEGMCGNAWEFKDGFKEGKRKLIESPSYGSYVPDEELDDDVKQ